MTTMRVKGREIGIIEKSDVRFNKGLVISVDGKVYHAIKQGGMLIWAFNQRPELEQAIGRDNMKRLDQWFSDFHKFSGR